MHLCTNFALVHQFVASSSGYQSQARYILSDTECNFAYCAEDRDNVDVFAATANTNGNTDKSKHTRMMKNE